MFKYELKKVTIDDVVFFSAYVVMEKDWNGFALPYFTQEEGRRLCQYLNVGRKDEWTVINLTDGIIASAGMTKTDAEKFIKEFPLRYKEQGFYLTSNNERIKPDDVKLELEAIESEEEIHESLYDEKADKFIVQEQAGDEEYEPIEYPGEDIIVDGKSIHVYPIGTGSWIWSTANSD